MSFENNDTVASKLPETFSQRQEAGTLTRDDFRTPEEKAASATIVNDYEALYRGQQNENARLQALITANRNSRANVAPQSTKAAVLADRVKAEFGPVGFLKASRDEKLLAMGVDPASITDEGLLRTFGKRNDPTLGQELMRRSPARYAQLRQAALMLGLYAA